MDRPTGTTRTGTAAAAVLTLAGPTAIYLAAASVAAAADGVPLGRVSCFDPGRWADTPVLRLCAAVAMTIGATCFLFVVPGLLATLAFMRRQGTRATAHAWSLAVNSAALILIFLLLRNTCGVNRFSMTVAWLVWSGVLFRLAWRPGESGAVLGSAARRYGGGLLIGLAAAVVAGGVFFPEQFLQCFSEDGTETYELARSLREHFLPQWELETWDAIPGGRMGTVVVNPSLINSYWTCGLQILLGDGELATRLPYWIWSLAIFAVAYRIARPGGRSLPAAGLIGLTMFLGSLLFTFYVGYNPYMADLANPGVPDAMFTLLLLLSLDCLRHNDRWGWAVTMTLASLVLYAGAVLTVLTLAAIWWWRPISPKECLRWALTAGPMLVAAAACYLCYGWLDGSLPYWIDTLDIEYVNDYLAGGSRWKSGPLFAGYFLLGCGVIPAWGLIRAFRADPWQRTVATAALLYLLVVLGSGFKNLHYLGPLLPVPVVLLLVSVGCVKRTTSNALRCVARTLPGYTSAAAALVICIIICWPADRQTYTLNRQLGTHTTIATDDYLTAVQWARIRHDLKSGGVMAFDCDQHTWVAYADLDSDMNKPRTLVLTDDGPPTPEYRPVDLPAADFSHPTGRLYTRDPAWTERFLAQEPLRPLERYPLVFRPLADGPYSPHNNTLEDVRRLR